MKKIGLWKKLASWLLVFLLVLQIPVNVFAEGWISETDISADNDFLETENAANVEEEENTDFVDDEKIEETENDGPQKAVKTLFIDDLCVDKDARGQKLGEKLYQFALDYAKELGCYNLTLHVWNDNAGAVRFYERLGMKPRYTEMETILK